jgi:hypothetical protein
MALPVLSEIGGGDHTILVGVPEVPMVVNDKRLTVLLQPTDGVRVGTVLVTAHVILEASVAPEQEVKIAW